MHTGFCGQNLKEGDCFENLGIDWKIILEQILRKQYGRCVYWIHMAQKKGQWQTVVNMVFVDY